jgi:beta-glucosidase
MLRSRYTGGSGSGAVPDASKVSPMTALEALGLDVTYELGATTEAAMAAAKAADIAIVFGSAHTGEGHDRLNLTLSANIDEIIPAVGGVQKKTIVVLSTPGSILSDWRATVPAILYHLRIISILIGNLD